MNRLEYDDVHHNQSQDKLFRLTEKVLLCCGFRGRVHVLANIILVYTTIALYAFVLESKQVGGTLNYL